MGKLWKAREKAGRNLKKARGLGRAARCAFRSPARSGLTPSWGSWRPLGRFLGRSWVFLGRFWARLHSKWRFEAMFFDLGVDLVELWSIWGLIFFNFSSKFRRSFEIWIYFLKVWSEHGSFRKHRKKPRPNQCFSMIFQSLRWAKNKTRRDN